MKIRTVQPEDIGPLTRLWNACGEAGETLYSPLTEAGFREKFLEGEGRDPDNLLVADRDGAPVGFIHGVAPETFRGGKPGNAYLTVLLVDAASRNRGIGKALLNALKERMREQGAANMFISSVNPVNLNWRIPGTPGHDHNNMPGLDTGCAGAGFFSHMGFENRYAEVAMYMNLADYRMPESVLEKQEALRRQGIVTGVYDPAQHCGFDAMCDHVGSEYWRDVLRTETEAWEKGQPNSDARFWPDGVRPQGPRPLLAAVHGGQIVGFTGPVDLQKSGRGWFTGICTDPAFERRGIATVLFNLLMEAFVKEGAQFSTLFTGADNHAQRVYRAAGMRPVREFQLMLLPLEAADSKTQGGSV